MTRPLTRATAYIGINTAKNGATTGTFVAGGYWDISGEVVWKILETVVADAIL